jgi:hypothetical protein
LTLFSASSFGTSGPIRGPYVEYHPSTSSCESVESSLAFGRRVVGKFECGRSVAAASVILERHGAGCEPKYSLGCGSRGMYCWVEARNVCRSKGSTIACFRNSRNFATFWSRVRLFGRTQGLRTARSWFVQLRLVNIVSVCVAVRKGTFGSCTRPSSFPTLLSPRHWPLAPRRCPRCHLMSTQSRCLVLRP